jgi:phosphoribosylformimino-5-aminoimidazole carboxamide ribotide isomerase
VIALWPAIDLMGGEVVRLLHGDPGKRTVYPERPVDVARRFAAEGADGIHVVDLDAAFGKGSNAGPIAEIVHASTVPVEVGGGLRDRATVEAALSAGAARVVLGSLPFRAPELFASLVRDLGPRLVVALDCKEGRPTIHGWAEDAGAGGAAEVARRLAAQGVSALLVTDVACDGAMTGPNLDLLAGVRAVFAGEILASGGMRGEEDLAPASAALAGGRAGAIFGRALHSGATTVARLAAARAALKEGTS